MSGNFKTNHMKRVINEKFKSFRIIICRFLKRTWPIAALLFMTSCTVENQINKQNFNRIPEHFSARFYDKLDTLDYHYNNRIYTRSLMKDFSNLTTINYAKPIQIDINHKELFLSFEDVNGKQYVLEFYGKRQKNRFIFYTNYETVSFPIIFIKKEMTKYAVYVADENEIIFEQHNVNEDMFFLFGGGSASELNYKFKLLTNE